MYVWKTRGRTQRKLYVCVCVREGHEIEEEQRDETRVWFIKGVSHSIKIRQQEELPSPTAWTHVRQIHSRKGEERRQGLEGTQRETSPSTGRLFLSLRWQQQLAPWHLHYAHTCLPAVSTHNLLPAVGLLPSRTTNLENLLSFIVSYIVWVWILFKIRNILWNKISPSPKICGAPQQACPGMSCMKLQAFKQQKL